MISSIFKPLSLACILLFFLTSCGGNVSETDGTKTDSSLANKEEGKKEKKKHDHELGKESNLISPAPISEKDKREVESILKDHFQAINNGDAKKALSYIHQGSSLYKSSEKGLQDEVKRKVRYEIQSINPHTFSKGVAIVMSDHIYHVPKNNFKVRHNINYTFLKIGNEWKIANWVMATEKVLSE